MNSRGDRNSGGSGRADRRRGRPPRRRAHLAVPARRPPSGRPRGQQRSCGQPASAAPASRPPRPSDLLAAGQPGPRLHAGRRDYVGEHQHRPRKWNLADHRHVDRHHVHQWSHLPRRPPLPTRPPLPGLTAQQGATPSSSSFRQGWPTGLPWLVDLKAAPRIPGRRMSLLSRHEGHADDHGCRSGGYVRAWRMLGTLPRPSGSASSTTPSS